MKPEKQRLIQDVLGDGVGQSAPLEAGVRALRRRRHWRTARRAVAGALVLAAAALWLGLEHRHHVSLQASAPAPRPSGPSNKQSLTDEQLLALFPDTPVALATLADGRKRLIFPRPEDEQRFVRYP